MNLCTTMKYVQIIFEFLKIRGLNFWVLKIKEFNKDDIWFFSKKEMWYKVKNMINSYLIKFLTCNR